MKSNKSSELHELDRDLPTGPADIAALRRARRDTIRDLKLYFEFLAGFPAPPARELISRKGPAGPTPFEL
jgi:hypothetical protein